MKIWELDVLRSFPGEFVTLFLRDAPKVDSNHSCGEMDRLKAVKASRKERLAVAGGDKLPRAAIITIILPLRSGQSNDGFLHLRVADADGEPPFSNNWSSELIFR